MKKLLVVLFILFLINSDIAQEQLAIRKKVILLQSSRSDVEKFARFVKDFDGYIRYETSNEFIDVSYTLTSCIGHGWNVPTDRILSYSSYPKRELLLEDLLKLNKNLFQLSDDIGTSHYINSSNGIEFVVRAGENKVEYIEFSPSESDSSLRCKGFPKYDLISDHYPPLDTFSVKKTATWDVGEMVNTFARVEEDPNIKGYIFVYCKKSQIAKCNQLKKKIERVAKIFMVKRPKQLTVSVGGYRDETRVETFLVPKDYPPAVARPKYPSNF